MRKGFFVLIFLVLICLLTFFPQRAQSTSAYSNPEILASRSQFVEVAQLNGSSDQIHFSNAEYPIKPNYSRRTLYDTLAPDNIPPTLDPIGSKTVDEGANLSFTATASDPDTIDTLSFSLAASPPSGASIGSASGIFSWTPTESEGPNDHTFDVCVTDGTAEVCESITVTVNEVNIPPTLAPIGDKTVNELTQLTFTASATDPDLPSNQLNFSLKNNPPSGANIGSTSGAFSWTPSESQGPNDYTFDVCVTDGAAEVCETITVTVNEVNAPPTLNPIGNKSVNEGTLLSFTASATDPDPSPTLTFSLQAGFPSGASIGSSSGVFTWTPSESQGPSSPSINVCVSDGEFSDCEQIQVTVNEVNLEPSISPISNKVVNELSLLTFTANATDPDLPLNPLTFSLQNNPPSGASIGSSSGIFTWTPSEIQGPSSPSFNVCVGDGEFQSCVPITVTVNEVNAPPVLATIGAKSVDELTQLSFTALATDPDIPPNTLSYSLTGTIPSGATIGPSSGVFNWTPTEAQGPNTYNFNVCVSDSAAQNCENITVTVNEVNAPPTITAITDQVTNEDTPTSAIPFTIGDPETTAAALTLSATSSNLSLVPNTNIGLDGLDSARTLTITPALNQFGTTTITVTVTDANSASTIETFLLTVNSVNDLPTITDVTDQFTDEDTPTAAIPFTIDDIETLASDIVLTGSSSNPLVVPNANIIFGGSGTDRTVTINPALNEYGPTTITLTATDLDGGFITDTFQLTVNPIPDLPTIMDIPDQVTNEDTPTGALPFTVSDAETLSDFLIVQATSSNQVLVPDLNITIVGTGEARTITVSPEKNQFGVAIITVTVIDGDGATATDTFSLTVNPINDPPVALGDFYETAHDKTLKVPSPGLLANDSDIDGDELIPFMEPGQGPFHGTVTLRLGGAFDYKPDPGYIGSDSFQYTVSDVRSDSLTSNIAQVSINIYDVNSPRVSWKLPVSNGEQYDVECEDIILEVEAIDDLSVDRVVLTYYDYEQEIDVPIKTFYSPPFRTTFNTCVLNPDFNQINAVAYDSAGNNSGYPAFIWLFNFAYSFYLPVLGN